MEKKIKQFFLLSCLFLLSCQNTDPFVTTYPLSTKDADLKIGYLIDNPVEGVGYQTETQSGYTDFAGRYYYKEGENITFFIGNLELVTIPAIGLITPFNFSDLNLRRNFIQFFQSCGHSINVSRGSQLNIDFFAADEASFQAQFDTTLKKRFNIQTWVDTTTAENNLKEYLRQQFNEINIQLTSTLETDATQDAQVTASFIYKNEAYEVDLSKSVKWVLEQTNGKLTVAQISSSGRITALNPGQTIVHAIYYPVIDETNNSIANQAKLVVTIRDLSNIAIRPFISTVPLNTEQQFDLYAYYKNNTNEKITYNDDVEWSSTNTDIKINNTGTTKGLLSKSPLGTTNIKASYNGMEAKLEIKIVSQKIVSEFIIEPAQANLMETLTQQFHAIVKYNDGSEEDVTTQTTWSSNNTNVTVNANNVKGLVKGLSSADVTIKAQFSDENNNTFTKETSLKVYGSAGYNVSLAVTPVNLTLLKNKTAQFQAIASFQNGTDNFTQDVTEQVVWNLPENTTNYAEFSNVTKGLLTAKASTLNYGSGTLQVTAKLNLNNNSHTGSTNLTIRALNERNARRLEITPNSFELAIGKSTSITAKLILYNDPQDGEEDIITNVTNAISWENLSNNNVKINISNESFLTIPSGSTTGTAQFRLRYAEDLSLEATTDITVTATEATWEGLEITPTSPSLVLGKTMQLNAYAYKSDGSFHDKTEEVSWTSTAIATVEKGKITTLSTGTTEIRANFLSFSDSVYLTVTPATIESIIISPQGITLAKGKTQQYLLTGTYSDGSIKDITTDITWKSEAPSIASIDSDGLLTANSQGATNITATTNGKVTTTNVNVTVSNLESLKIEPETGSEETPLGIDKQLKAYGIYSDQKEYELTDQVVWTIEGDQTIATIDSSGLLKTSLTTTGAVTVKATYYFAEDTSIDTTIRISITNPILLSININPASLSLAKGTTGQFNVIGTFSNNTTSSITSINSWSSSNSSFAIIDGTGKVKALNEGEVTITALKDTKISTASLTITPPVLNTIEITSSTGNSVPLGYENQLITGKVTAKGIYTDGTSKDITEEVTWSSSNESVATIENQEGDIKTNDIGDFTITATKGGITSSISLKVEDTILRSITVTHPNTSIAKGLNEQFNATGTYVKTTQDINADVTWKSNNTNILTINSDGEAKGESAGITTVTATYKNDSAITGTSTITVTEKIPVAITLSPTHISIPKELGQQFTIQIIYSDDTVSNSFSAHEDLTWSSSNTNTASVSSSGYLTANNIGSTIVGAMMNISINSSQYSLESTTDVEVTTPSLTEILIKILNSTANSIPNGIDPQMQAIGTYINDSTADITEEVAWSIIAGSSFATISNTSGLKGKVTTNTPGNVTIQAELNSINNTFNLIVSDAYLMSLNISAVNNAYKINDEQVQLMVNSPETVQLKVEGAYTDGTTNINLTNHNDILWASNTTNNLTVSNNAGNKGVLTAIKSLTTPIQVNAEYQGTDIYGSEKIQDTISVMIKPEVIDLSAGGSHTCAIIKIDATSSNTIIKCWGSNAAGQLGLGYSSANASSPEEINTFTNALQISAGGNHTCAIDNNQTVYCWGDNDSGQLGIGNTDNKASPTLISSFDNIIQISVGTLHTCAINHNQAAYCWGDNSYGQTGDGNSGYGIFNTTPTQILSDSTTTISAGGDHTCARINDNTVKCWGDNFYGQLGNNSTDPSSTPVLSSNLNTALNISLGNEHSCAKLNDGTIQCWGNGANGQIGNGNTEDTNQTPMTVSNITTVSKIDAGSYHTCAIDSEYNAYCWGEGLNGKLGNSDTDNKLTPTLVPEISNVLKISAGGEHTCAVVKNGDVYCWGDNSKGQIGNNNTTDQSTPVKINLQ